MRTCEHTLVSVACSYGKHRFCQRFPGRSVDI